MSEISVEMLHRLLVLDPENGELYWRERTPDLFEECQNPERVCRWWNTRYAGTRALCTLSGKGYWHGSIFDRNVQRHRVVWALTHGYWPKYIDHLDGNPLNNTPSNLRECTKSENARNQKMRCTNTSGHNGVYWHKPLGKYRARITLDGKTKHLGNFDKLDDAIAARKAAEEGQGYTERHGT